MSRWESELITTTLSGTWYSNDKYRIYVYGSISIQILAGKIQNCITAWAWAESTKMIKSRYDNSTLGLQMFLGHLIKIQVQMCLKYWICNNFLRLRWWVGFCSSSSSCCLGFVENDCKCALTSARLWPHTQVLKHATTPRTSQGFTKLSGTSLH